MRRFLFGIFVTAFLLRMLLAWRVGFFHRFEYDEMSRIAFSLAEHRGFGNPYIIPTGPTAHEMPLYPRFLASIYSIFGFTPAAEAVKITIACLVAAVRCALLPLFALDIGLSRNTARAVGILSAIYVGALETELRGTWDGPLQALLLLLLAWTTIRGFQTGWREKAPWSYSLLWAFAALLQPLLLVVLAVLVAVGWFAVADRRQFLRDIAILLCTVIVFFTPWVARNYIRFGVLMPTRSNFGLEFAVSNGPGRAYDLPSNIRHQPRHPSESSDEAALVAELGEVRYNRMRLAEGLAWVRGNPGGFARLTAERAWAWWFPPGRNWAHRALQAGFSLAALVGMAFLFRVNRIAGTVLAAIWLSFPMVYYIIQWSSRYRSPMEWSMVVCAALTLTVAAEGAYLRGDADEVERSRSRIGVRRAA